MAGRLRAAKRTALPPGGTPLKLHEWDHIGEESRRWICDAAERERQNSQNSSLPPSRDKPEQKAQTNEKARRRRSKKKRRRPGGQPGHPGHRRPMVPPDRVDEQVEHFPNECRRCGHEFAPEDFAAGAVHHHQTAEIPEIVPQVTDHALHSATCPCCLTKTTAKLPPGVPTSCFGPNLRSLIVLLIGRYRISRREVTDLCQSVFGLCVSLGSVANILRRSSDALAAPYEEVAAAVQKARVGYMDETGWRQKGKGAHLWILATVLCVLFRIGRRTKAVAQEMLGEGYDGSVVTDRYFGYRWLANEQHQVCWAHLDRDFEKLSERGGAAGIIGEAFQDVADDLFATWRAYKAGRIRWETMQRRMAPIEMRAGEVIASGTRCRDPAARSLCESLSKIEPSLFVFSRIEGVEPTNNLAERGIRPAVQWRKICFGTQSRGGSHFVERILTVVATCKVQNRPLLPYLRQVLVAADSGDPIPSLLTAPTCAHDSARSTRGDKGRRLAG